MDSDQPHPLRAYRRAHGMTLAGFGKLVGLSKSRMSAIENGESTSLRVAVAIEKVTDGKVRAADLRGHEKRAP